MLWQLVFIFLIILIGSFIQGTTGFGMGLFSMGFLPMFISLKDSSLLVISLTMILSLSIVIKLYKHIEIKGFWLILGAALTGRILSFFFLTSFGELDSLKKWLGLFLVAMVIFLVYHNKRGTPPSLLHPLAPVILGLFGGFIGGTFAVGGPFFVFYFLMLYKDKYSYNANLQTTFFLTSIFTIILHTINGDFSSTHYLHFFIGVVSVVVGASIGLKLFEKIPREKIQTSAMFIVILAAFNLILFT